MKGYAHTSALPEVSGMTIVRISDPLKFYERAGNNKRGGMTRIMRTTLRQFFIVFKGLG